MRYSSRSLESRRRRPTSFALGFSRLEAPFGRSNRDRAEKQQVETKKRTAQNEQSEQLSNQIRNAGINRRRKNSRENPINSQDNRVLGHKLR